MPRAARASSARPATSPPAVTPAAPERGSARGAGHRQPDGDGPRRAERERDRHGAETDRARAEEEPEIAAVRVVQPATGPRPHRHAERGDEADGAEDAAHRALAEVLAHDDR